MKKIIVLLVVVVCSGFFVGCRDDKGGFEQAKTEQIMKEINAAVGMPSIRNFHEKKLAKMLFELRDNPSLVCYAYLFNEREGKIGQYLGECVGYGLPYSVQYTNPDKLVDRYGDCSDKMIERYVLPQADPNGLYMPTGLSATWLMMLDPVTKEIKPVYVEPQIIVSQFKLHKEVAEEK